MGAANPITPQATREPALPVFLLSSSLPRPKIKNFYRLLIIIKFLTNLKRIKITTLKIKFDNNEIYCKKISFSKKR